MAKYIKVGSGWFRHTKKDNKEFISVSTKSKDKDVFQDVNPRTKVATNTRLYVQIGEEEPVQVSNLSIFPTDADKERYPNSPDFSVTFTLED